MKFENAAGAKASNKKKLPTTPPTHNNQGAPGVLRQGGPVRVRPERRCRVHGTSKIRGRLNLPFGDAKHTIILKGILRDPSCLTHVCEKKTKTNRLHGDTWVRALNPRMWSEGSGLFLHVLQCNRIKSSGCLRGKIWGEAYFTFTQLLATVLEMNYVVRNSFKKKRQGPEARLFSAVESTALAVRYVKYPL